MKYIFVSLCILTSWTYFLPNNYNVTSYWNICLSLSRWLFCSAPLILLFSPHFHRSLSEWMWSLCPQKTTIIPTKEQVISEFQIIKEIYLSFVFRSVLQIPNSNENSFIKNTHLANYLDFHHVEQTLCLKLAIIFSVVPYRLSSGDDPCHTYILGCQEAFRCTHALSSLQVFCENLDNTVPLMDKHELTCTCSHCTIEAMRDGSSWEKSVLHCQQNLPSLRPLSWFTLELCIPSICAPSSSLCAALQPRPQLLPENSFIKLHV